MPKKTVLGLTAKGRKKAGLVHQRGEIRGAAEKHLGELVLYLDKSRGDMGEKIRRQNDELKIKNDQLRNGANKLQQSDEQIRLLTKAIESIADGVFIIAIKKAAYPVVYSNNAFRMMASQAESKGAGMNLSGLFGAGADQRIIREIKQAIQRGEYYYTEMQGLNQDGKRYWNQLRMTPVRGSYNKITHYIGIQTDITLAQQRDQEIKKQREELLHVTRVGKLAEFVSSLAHEISQPLTAILSYSQAARRMLAGSQPKIRKILQYIIHDDQRAVEVIRRMRSLLKKSEPEMKRLDINSVIHETIRLITADAVSRNCVITADLERNLPPIHGDQIQLQQVLLNLFSNSFDAMESTPGPRAIGIRTSRVDKKTLQVTVNDTGTGIAKAVMPNLFNRFFTSKPDGLGMGLSISRTIIEAHGGRLEAKDNSKPGATFCFSLPINRTESL